MDWGANQTGEMVSTSQQKFTTDLKGSKLVISKTRVTSLWPAEKGGINPSFLYLFQLLS